MKIQRLLILLTLTNMALLILALAQFRTTPVAAQGVALVLRGRALQIVDGQGRVRANINVLPASTQKNGESSHETVLLRLITERGRPSVKIGASEESAGLALVGPHKRWAGGYRPSSRSRVPTEPGWWQEVPVRKRASNTLPGTP
jgi:hypothetical protein